MNKNWFRKWSEPWRVLVWRSEGLEVQLLHVSDLDYWGQFSSVLRYSWMLSDFELRYNYLIRSLDWMTSSSPQDTNRRLLTLMIVINQIKQYSVIMRTKLWADTNNTQLRAILLFLLWQRIYCWSQTGDFTSLRRKLAFILTIWADAFIMMTWADAFILMNQAGAFTLMILADAFILMIWANAFILIIWADAFILMTWADAFILLTGTGAFYLK